MEENLTMADLMADVDKQMGRKFRKNEEVEVTVVAVSEKDGLTVDLGVAGKEGQIYWNEFSDDAEERTAIKEGDTFKAIVKGIKREDKEGKGSVLLSRKAALARGNFDEVKKLFEEKAPVVVKITSTTKGGVVANLKGIRAFIPASQITNQYVEDLSSFVGKEITAEIIDLDEEKHRLVLSGKAIAQKAANEEKAKQLAEIEEGATFDAVVTKLMPYGAFVRVGAIEGLIHNNDLAWGHVKHPSDVVKEGQTVQVKVNMVDKEKGKVGFSLKDLVEDPWFVNTANFEVGQDVDAEITRTTNFGAFAKIADGVEGLIHISEISNQRVEKVEDALKVGETVKARIISIDKETKRIGLSIKAAQ